MSDQLIDRTFYSPYNLTGSTEYVLVVHQQIGQIIMPEIAGEAKVPGHLNQPVSSFIIHLFQYAAFFFFVMVQYPDHIFKDSSIFKIAIDH